MKSFPAKLLLFGEYSVIMGSHALTYPYPVYSGCLSFEDDRINSEKAKQSNRLLSRLIQNFEKSATAITEQLDIQSFCNDIENRMFFDSDIPMNYGLGSSGALVAAIFDRYRLNEPDTLSSIQKVLADIESVFHGKSSGLDPLTSYVNKPLFLSHNGIVEIEKNGMKWVFNNLYLFDTGIHSKTGPLVKSFLENIGNEAFRNSIQQDYIPKVDRIITALSDGDRDRFNHLFQALSAFQYKAFHEMIPNSLKEIWNHGILTGEYYFKLCGSGGGGNMFVYSEKLTQKQLTSIFNKQVRAIQ